jgi:hypothetical protein
MVLPRLLGSKYFQVRLPDGIVFVDANGEAGLFRLCTFNSDCSPKAVPDHPKLGIVGTVQLGPPDYEPAKNFSVSWTSGSTGDVFISGHCFSAFSNSERPVLTIGAPGLGDVTLKDAYGYRLTAVWLEPESNMRHTGSTMRISESEFSKSRDCNDAARRAWPNIGGFSWKR